MSRKKEEAAKQEAIQRQISRIRLPRGKQSLGLVEQRVGGSRMRVRCLDAKERICRIPGRLKRSLWVRAGDITIIEPWELGGDAKGDVIYKYTRNQVGFLKKNGYLRKLESLDEF